LAQDRQADLRCRCPARSPSRCSTPAAMSRLALAALAVLLAGHGCVAHDTTTMGEERRLQTTAAPASDTPDSVSAAPRAGGLGTVLLVLLGFLYAGSAAGAALDESTTMAEGRRLATTEADPGTPDVTSFAPPRVALQAAPVLGLAAALGLGARR